MSLQVFKNLSFSFSSRVREKPSRLSTSPLRWISTSQPQVERISMFVVLYNYTVFFPSKNKSRMNIYCFGTAVLRDSVHRDMHSIALENEKISHQINKILSSHILFPRHMFFVCTVLKTWDWFCQQNAISICTLIFKFPLNTFLQIFGFYGGSPSVFAWGFCCQRGMNQKFAQCIGQMEGCISS